MTTHNAEVMRAVVRRRLAAPRQRVFRAWTEAEQLQRWFFPTLDGQAMPRAEVDLRVGGRYRIAMYTPDGHLAALVGGTYHDIQPPTKLVFSWAWELPQPDASETLVTVEFHEVAGETEVVIVQERLPDPTAAERRTIGWICALDRLTQLVEVGASIGVALGDPCRR
jgi:uncharacterized protein YndB with AHSA1/START domain